MFVYRKIIQLVNTVVRIAAVRLGGKSGNVLYSSPLVPLPEDPKSRSASLEERPKTRASSNEDFLLRKRERTEVIAIAITDISESNEMISK